MSEAGGAVAVYFFDSSEIVKRYAIEPGSAWVDSICDEAAGNIVALSQIGLAEVAAALAAKRRADMISVEDYEQTLAEFITDTHQQYLPVAVDVALIELAVALTGRQKLRGCDSIQLASALTLNASLASQGLPPLTFVAADADLLAAAAAEGLAVEDPGLHP